MNRNRKDTIQVVLSTQKKITSMVALGLSAVLLFGSTFAWQSLNQEALNYVRGGANPGGRLHDDFNNVTFQVNADGSPKYTTKTYDKDVYVENFTSPMDDGVNIYARVRLDEYMEIGVGAGTKDDNENVTVLGSSTAKLTNTDTWTTHIPGEDSNFSRYWAWDMAGQTTYMPTFDKNKDSLAADINGTFDAAFADYVDYSEEKYGEEGDGRTAYAIYDNDNNTTDELTNSKVNVKELIQKGTAAIPEEAEWADAIRINQETHTAKKSLESTVMTMAQYLEKLNAEDDFNGRGNFWVWDTDGWAYWANPIQPQTATGLLLDQIQRTATPIGSGEDEWYYGINVVAQFITADDLGKDDNTGFYDTKKGTAPSVNALALLERIGVDTEGDGAALTLLDRDEVEVGDEYELRAALEEGKDVVLTEDIELDAPVVVEQSAYVYLNGCAITPRAEFAGRALFIVSDGAWLDFDDSGIVQAPADGCAVWVDQDSHLYIWDGTFVGGDSAVYVESGEAVIVDGTFYLQEEGGQLLDWCAGDGEITVYRGTFYNFDPSNVHGESLLEDGYTVETEVYGDDTVYTVTAEFYEPLPEDPILPDEELPTEGEDGDELPEGGTEGGDTVTDDVPGETENDNSGTSADAAGAVTDVPEASTPGAPESSVIESTENGALSGISGKADVVEPEAPTGDVTDAGPAGDVSSAGDTEISVTDEETVG